MQTASSVVGLIEARRTLRPLRIDIEEREDVCLLRVEGCFRTGADPDYLRRKMEEITALPCLKLVADLGAVPSVGSEGVSFLVGLYRISGGRLVLVATQFRVREVLDIMGLSGLIPSVENLDSGLAYLQAPPPGPQTAAAFPAA
jgi:anti-anti-sigma factor